MMKLRFAAVACLVFVQASFSYADIVVLKDGSRHQTDRVIPMAGAYYFKSAGKMMNVSAADVERIERETTVAPARADAAATQTIQQEPQRPVEEAELAFITRCRAKMEAEAVSRKSDYEMTCAKALAMVEGLYTGDPPQVEMFEYYFDIIEGKAFWNYLSREDGEKLKAILYRTDGPLDRQYIAFEEEREDLAQRTAQARHALANPVYTPRQQTPSPGFYNPYLMNPYASYPSPYTSTYPNPFMTQFGPFSAYGDAFGNAYLGNGYSSFQPNYSFYPNQYNPGFYRDNSRYLNQNRNPRGYTYSRDTYNRGYQRRDGGNNRPYRRGSSTRYSR